MSNETIVAILLNLIAAFPSQKKSEIIKIMSKYKSFYGAENTILIPDIIQDCLNLSLINASGQGLFTINKAGRALIKKGEHALMQIVVYHSTYTHSGIALRDIKKITYLSPACSNIEHGNWKLQDELQYFYLSDGTISLKSDHYRITKKGISDYYQKLSFTI